MQNSELLELIKEVSKSNLTSFSYEEGNVKVSFKKQGKETASTVVTESAETVPVLIEDKKTETKSGVLVESPLVGTFYAAPEEDAKAFVSVGDSVKKGQVLAIIEAMKLMNEIEAECDGVIEEVLVANGEVVEYGQPLFRIAG